MRHLLFISALLVACSTVGIRHAEAHNPEFVSITQHGETVIEQIDISTAFYGELNDFPHLFSFTAKEEFELFVEILAPDVDGAVTEFDGIILRKKKRGVDEVARLKAETASWESFFEWFGGDSYLRGPSFRERLPAGDYAIEVSTPVNRGKYVLVVGTREEFAWSEFGATLRDIQRVKAFFGKSSFAVLQSPFAYIPLLILVCVGYFGFRMWRRRQGADIKNP